MIRECFAVRYQHLTRVLSVAQTKAWAIAMDQVIRNGWAKAMTIPALNSDNIQQRHLPIKKEGFGVFSYVSSRAAAHIVSRVSYAQTCQKYDGKAVSTMPHLTMEAIQTFEEDNKCNIETLLKRSWGKLSPT